MSRRNLPLGQRPEPRHPEDVPHGIRHHGLKLSTLGGHAQVHEKILQLA
jgi:hypothetical protein